MSQTVNVYQRVMTVCKLVVVCKLHGLAIVWAKSLDLTDGVFVNVVIETLSMKHWKTTSFLSPIFQAWHQINETPGRSWRTPEPPQSKRAKSDKAKCQTVFQNPSFRSRLQKFDQLFSVLLTYQKVMSYWQSQIVLTPLKAAPHLQSQRRRLKTIKSPPLTIVPAYFSICLPYA